MLINLTSNAIKAIKTDVHRAGGERPKEIEISVDTSPLDDRDERCSVIVGVRDTGFGMSDAELSRTLRMRLQLRTPQQGATYGTSGIGLSISQAILDALGGHMGVVSTVGEGTTFTFDVPCARSSASSSIGHAAPSPSPPFPVEVPYKLYHVLVVEDNLINQATLKRIIESAEQDKLPCAVTVANDGEEALRLATQTSFDFILMDIEMPVMDGLESTRRIRQHEVEHQQERVPIIGLSANARQEHVREGLDSGMDEYLTKPCRKHEILACLKRHFVEKVGASSVQAPSSSLICPE